MTRRTGVVWRLVVAWHAVVGSSLLLVRRRARRDVLLLVAWCALAAFAVLLAVGGPRFMGGTVDSGAREAVAAAGADADVLVHAEVGVRRLTNANRVVLPEEVLDVAHQAATHLPKTIQSVEAGSALAVRGHGVDVRSEDVTPRLTVARIQLRVAMLTPANVRELSMVDGSLPATDPGPPDSPIGVVVSEQAARASSLRVGSVVAVREAAAGLNTPPLMVTITGVVQNDDSNPVASAWTDLPELWSPEAAATPSSPALGITVLAQPDGVSRASEYFAEPFDATLRVRLDADSFTHDKVGRVSSEIDGIVSNSSTLAPSSTSSLRVSSDFGDALSDYSGRARAATAQMSVVLVGVLGVVLAVLVLLSRLLVMRRSGEISLERSRGASLPSVVLRFLLESMLACVVAVLAGIGLATLVLPGPVREPLFLIVVVAVALLSAPVQAAFLVASQRIRRAAVQRRDRLESVRRRAARRLTIEALVIALAAAALVSLQSRGLLQTVTVGVDPLLSAAPLLAAAAVAVVVLRVYPWPVRLVGALGRRTRGALGLLGAVRARRSITVLPLLALTLAVGLAAGSALIGDTVRSGQQEASWQRIGADLRADGPIDPDQVTRVANAAGVEAAASFRAIDGVHLNLGTESPLVTLMAVDHRYFALLDELPRLPGVAHSTDAHAIGELGRHAPATDALRVVVDPEIASRLESKDITMTVGDLDIPLSVVASGDAGPDGYLDGPFVYVDLDSLSQRLPEPIEAGTLLVVGPGAEAAVAASDVPQKAVQTRSGWIAAWGGQAMIAGVQGVLSLSAVALGVLAMIALLATVLAGAGERARSLSLLRTLGMPVGLGWWLALAELTPLVVGALVGGVVAGVVVVVLLGPALGLGVLAGGLYDPAPTVSWWFIAGLLVVSAVLLATSVCVEVLARRRDRVSDVLRVGETV